MLRWMTGILVLVVLAVPAEAEVVTLQCDPRSPELGKFTMDVDTDSGVVTLNPISANARTVTARVNQRAISFVSPYTNKMVQLDRLTGEFAEGAWTCRRASKGGVL